MTAAASVGTSPEVQLPGRLRVRYAKQGRIRFTSQRDVARMWERALRRSRLPLAWSEGFSPHPLLSFSLALPTGCESLAEYLDIRLQAPAWTPPGGAGRSSTPGDDGGAGERRESDGALPGWLPGWLSGLLPEGIEVVAVAAGVGAASLQEEVTSCSWDVEVQGVTATELAERVERMLDAPRVPVSRVRKGRLQHDDLRPSVRSLVVAPAAARGMPAAPGQPAGPRLCAELATRPRGVRPKELLLGLGDDVVLVRACRTHQWIERDGARTEPLPSGDPAPAAAPPPHPGERAS